VFAEEYTLQDLADRIGAKVVGDAECKINGLASISRAQPGQLTFLYGNHYKKYLESTQASAVLLDPDDLPDCPVNALVVPHPRACLPVLATLFSHVPEPQSGIDPSVVIGEHCSVHETASVGPYTILGDNVMLGEGVIIGPQCRIGEGVHIGDHTRLWANVVIYYDVHIGQRGLIHSGAILGADGFGMVKDSKGHWRKIPQLGTVMIGDDVEIGANTTIDRGALEDTVIENNVKLDNQIQIAHNVTIGQNTVIGGCTGIAGSVTIGANCMIGGAVGIADHVSIADQVTLTGMTAVNSSIKKPGIYSSGLLMQPYSTWRRNAARFRQLDKIAKQVNTLIKQSNHRDE